MSYLLVLIKFDVYLCVLSQLTGRTSMPSIFVGGVGIGGANDGNPGLFPLLAEDGLQEMLRR